MDDKNQPYLIPASIIVAGVIIAVAVMYAGLDETTRDKIIKYIFARQRKLLRTEKGKPE